MGMRFNAAHAADGGVVRVSTVEAGEVSAQDLREGKAARVKLRSGNLRTLGGEALRMALAQGATLVDPPVTRPEGMGADQSRE
jgi:hypothetical protein